MSACKIILASIGTERKAAVNSMTEDLETTDLSYNPFN